MNRKVMICLTALGSVLLIGCTGISAGTNGAAGTGLKEVEATGTEQALLAALNAARRAAGKAEVAVSPALARLARKESDAAAATGKLPGDTTASLKSRSGFGSVGKLQGALKDGGTATGKGFVDYWAKSPRRMLLEDWSKVGVGISKVSDGRLFAVVVFGNEGRGGSSLMDPAMSPSGF